MPAEPDRYMTEEEREAHAVSTRVRDQHYGLRREIESADRRMLLGLTFPGKPGVRVVEVYDPEELAAMSTDDLRDALLQEADSVIEDAEAAIRYVERMAQVYMNMKATEEALDAVENGTLRVLADLGLIEEIEPWEEELFRGYESGSRYAQLPSGLTVRISDHKQPPGGGFSMQTGQRYGVCDIDVVVDVETGRAEVFSQASADGWVSAAERNEVADALASTLGTEVGFIRECKGVWKSAGRSP